MPWTKLPKKSINRRSWESKNNPALKCSKSIELLKKHRIAQKHNN